MKRISKIGQEPPALTDYRQANAHIPANLVWTRFKKRTDRREAVKKQLRDDQRGLCAYCENALIPQDESVEHFVARDADHDRELDWINLLLCCAGGERPLPEDVADGAVRHDPTGSRTCGHAKLGQTTRILNPLDLPHTPRLFRFKSETGEIVPDEEECARAGVDVHLARNTIDVLGLKARRLSEARLAVMNRLIQDLAADGTTAPFTVQRERELASTYFLPTGTLPAFFTTVRFSLGLGAELHLADIGFQG
jgi:uncharacterized protein (TIGR02646 family)